MTTKLNPSETTSLALNKVKGIGEKLITQIVYSCELKVKEWEAHFKAEQQQEHAA